LKFKTYFKNKKIGICFFYRTKNFRPEYCFHVPAISGVSLQDPVTFPHLYCRIPRDPVAEIIDLGMDKVLLH
jgi:hypothetical protein